MYVGVSYLMLFILLGIAFAIGLWIGYKIGRWF